MSDATDIFCLQATAMTGTLNSPLTASYPFAWSGALVLVRELIASRAVSKVSVRAPSGPHTP